MNVELVNLIRIAVVIEGVYIIAVILFVIARYCKNVKTSCDKSRRILTAHIIMIGLSYVIFAGASIYQMMLSYNLPMTWRTPVFAIALSMGVLAMHLMLWRLMLLRKV